MLPVKFLPVSHIELSSTYHGQSNPSPESALGSGLVPITCTTAMGLKSHPTPSCVQPGKLLHSPCSDPLPTCLTLQMLFRALWLFSTLLLLLYLEGRWVVFKEAHDCLGIKDLLLLKVY